MTTAAQLIVLSTTKIGGNSVVVQTLSREFGRRGFLATVSRTTPAALFLPLNVLDAEVTENPKSDLWRMRGISCRYPLASIRTSPYKSAISLFMTEVLLRTVTEGAWDESLWEWCERSILTLDALENDYSNFHLRFLLELCGALGFAPTTMDLAPFAGDLYDSLRSLLSLSFEESMLLPLSGTARSAIADILIRYISYHTETALEIRSLPVLHDILTA